MRRYVILVTYRHIGVGEPEEVTLQADWDVRLLGPDGTELLAGNALAAVPYRVKEPGRALPGTHPDGQAEHWLRAESRTAFVGEALWFLKGSRKAATKRQLRGVEPWEGDPSPRWKPTPPEPVCFRWGGRGFQRVKAAQPPARSLASTAWWLLSAEEAEEYIAAHGADRQGRPLADIPAGPPPGVRGDYSGLTGEVACASPNLDPTTPEGFRRLFGCYPEEASR